jgi:hypothetical protein
VPVTCEVFAGVPHVWQMIGCLPEARQSVPPAATFLKTAAREHAARSTTC